MPPRPREGEPIVLVSRSSDPDGDPLQVRWFVDDNHVRILDGQTDWEWNDARAGAHTVTLEVTDGRGGQDRTDVSITVAKQDD